MGINDIWRGVNRGLRGGYRRLLARHPGLARRARATFYPLLLRANKRLLGTAMPDLTRPAADPNLRNRFRGHAPVGGGLRVSVIVPSYNHAAFLPARLASIADQTLAPHEVILLDDASDDGSQAILRDWAQGSGAHLRPRLILNDSNSGLPFAQWARGIEAATGDLIWIAESDDLAHPDFLARLVPLFENPGVTLAFGRTLFVDSDGQTEVARMEDQVPPGAAALYTDAFVEPSYTAVRKGFAHANLIPNVSGALLRRPASLERIEVGVWGQMRTAGDWVFYLNLLRGGMLAYEPAAVSLYRIHSANSSRAAHRSDAFYAEHATVLNTVARHYGLAEGDHGAIRQRLVPIWQAARHEPVERLEHLLHHTPPDPQTRPLRVLMLLPGLSGGGAEVAAITLANLLQRRGHAVTVLDMGLEGDEAPLAARLDPDIPLLGDGAALPEILSSFGIEVAHSHHAWVDQALLAVGTTAARVVSLHGMYETLPETTRAELLDQVDTLADAITAAAPANAEGLPSGRAQVIANAILPAPATPLPRAALDVAEDAFLVVLVSRAIPEKGWAEAIEAITHARARTGCAITLLLVGEGPEKARLAREGVPDWVRLTGYRSDVPAILAAADLALLPSRYPGESAPLAVLEALHAGVPVVATVIGQVPQMISRDGVVAGALVPLQDGLIDVAGFADAIAGLVSAPDRMAAARAAIPTVLPANSSARMVEEFEAVYRAAITRRGSAEDA